MRTQGCITQKYFLFVCQYDFFPRGPREPIEERAGTDLSWTHLSGLKQDREHKGEDSCQMWLLLYSFSFSHLTCEVKQNKQKQSMDTSKIPSYKEKQKHFKLNLLKTKKIYILARHDQIIYRSIEITTNKNMRIIDIFLYMYI